MRRDTATGLKREVTLNLFDGSLKFYGKPAHLLRLPREGL
jgi:hypothetical protein